MFVYFGISLTYTGTQLYIETEIYTYSHLNLLISGDEGAKVSINFSFKTTTGRFSLLA